MFSLLQALEAGSGADIDFVLVVAGGNDLNDEHIFGVSFIQDELDR